MSLSCLPAEAEDSAARAADDWADLAAASAKTDADGLAGSRATDAFTVPLPEQPCEKIWFHFGYMNFRSWEGTGLCLNHDPDQDDDDEGHSIDGQHNLITLTVDDDDDIVFRTLLETMEAKMDLNRSWSAELYEVLSLPVFIETENMVPDRIQVRAMRIPQHEGPLRVWKGAEREAAEREDAEARRKKARKPQARQQDQQPDIHPRPRQRPRLPPLFVERMDTEPLADEAGPAPLSPVSEGVEDTFMDPLLDLEPHLTETDSETEATPAWLLQAGALMQMEDETGELPPDAVHADDVPENTPRGVGHGPGLKLAKTVKLQHSKALRFKTLGPMDIGPRT